MPLKKRWIGVRRLRLFFVFFFCSLSGEHHRIPLSRSRYYSSYQLYRQASSYIAVLYLASLHLVLCVPVTGYDALVFAEAVLLLLLFVKVLGVGRQTALIMLYQPPLLCLGTREPNHERGDGPAWSMQLVDETRVPSQVLRPVTLLEDSIIRCP